MTLLVQVAFDKNEDGTLRKIPGGTIRFTLHLIDSETHKRVFSCTGWRIAPDGQQVLPPSSITKNGGIFIMGSMSPEMQSAVIAEFERQKQSETAKF
jgi:hypothetical protein